MDGIEEIRYLKSWLGNTEQLFVACDHQGIITYVNQRILNILGYHPEEVIGKALNDFVPKRHRYLAGGGENLLGTEYGKTREATLLHRNGKELVFRLKISPLIDEGQVVGEVLLGENVDEAHRAARILRQSHDELQSIREELTAANQQLTAAEEELRQQLMESETTREALADAHQQMEAIFNFLPDPSFVVDIDGRVTMWNRSIEELTGVRSREVLGKTNRAYAVPFFGDRRSMLIDMALGGDEDYSHFIFARRDRDICYGEVFCPHLGQNGVYLSVKSSPLFDRHGVLIGGIETLRDVSENRMAQRALQESEEKHRNIIESIEDGYFEVDFRGNFHFFNPWLLKVLGYEADEFRGANYRMIMDQENAEKVYQTFNKAYKTGESVKEFDWQVLKKDGGKLFVETTVIPIKDDSKVTGFRGIVRDITGRKQADEALRRSENLYRTIFENTGTATIILEEDLTVSLINSEMERLSGYSKEELEGKKPWTLLVDPADVQRMTEYHRLRRVNPEKTPRNYEFKLLTKDGSRRDIWLTIAMIPETSRSVTALLDITSRKMSEEALQFSEARYRAIVEDQTELICRFLPDGALTFVNETYCRYFNTSRDRILGRNFKQYYHYDDLEYVQQSIEELTKDDPVITLEHRVLLPGDEVRWQQWTHRALYNDKGILVNYQSVGRDVTERKLAEEQLKFLGTHDPLTGLFNRHYFEKQMSVLEAEGHHPIGLVMSDVDGLKIVNDTLGHDRGDHLLKVAARLINACFRKDDIVARVGGDEFAILLPRTSALTVENSLNRIREQVRNYNQEHPELPLSISMGFAVKQDHRVSMAMVFKEADNNMYREKLHSRLSTRSSIVQTLMKALEARDFITEGHGDRLQEFVEKMARVLDLPERTVNDLRLFAQFHDIGKVGVSDSILYKKGPLTPEEYASMQRHCEIGHRIALSAPELVPIADWILRHHEWWNGEGYPLGLRGEQIPLECRILALADAYDAMTNDRPYRQAMSHEEALEEIRLFSGRQFDPGLAEQFIEVLNKR